MTSKSVLKSGISPRQLVPAYWTTESLHFSITGAVRSATVKLVLQTAEFPASSVIVKVIGVIPRETEVPGPGTWVMTRFDMLLQLSEAITASLRSGTSARQFVSAGRVMGSGQLTTVGSVVSPETGTMALVEAIHPFASMTVMV